MNHSIDDELRKRPSFFSAPAVLIASRVLYVILAVVSLGDFALQRHWLECSTKVALWLHLAYGWWAALTVVFALHRLGTILMRLPFLGEWGAFPRPAVFFRLILGFWSLSCLLFLLSLAGVLNGSGGVAVFGFIMVLAVLDLWPRKATNTAALLMTEAPLPRFWPSRFQLCICLAVLLWSAPYVVQTLLPNTDWDGAMYHLPLAQRLLHDGLWSVDPYFLYYDFPCIPHLIYALFLNCRADTAILPFVFLISVGVVGAVYVLTDRFWGQTAARWATAMMLTANVLWEVGVTPRIDGFLALYLVLAVLAFLLWREEPWQRGLVPLIGLLLGLAMGVKYTSVIFSFLLGLSLVCMSILSVSHRRSLLGQPGLIAMLLFMTPSAFWYVRNGLVLGDPLYFMGRHQLVYRDDDGSYDAFDSLLQQRGGSLASSAKIDEALATSKYRFLLDPPQHTHHHASHLFNLWDLVRHPNRYDTKPRHSMGPFLLLGFLLPLVVWNRSALWLYALALAFYFSFAWQTYVIRFILPTFPLLASCSGVLVVNLFSRWSRQLPFLRPLAAAALVVYLGLLFGGQVRKCLELAPRAYLAGTESPISFLCHAGYNSGSATPQAIAFIDTQVDRGRLTPATTILMIAESKGELLHCRYLPDHIPKGYRWLVEVLQAQGDWKILKQRLQHQGISHLMINQGALEWSYHFNEVPFNTPLNNRYLRMVAYYMEAFLHNHCTILYQHDGVYFARINFDS